MTLDDIVEKVLKRLSERKALVSLEELKVQAGKKGPTRSFVNRVRRREGEKLRIIAEVKKASPSKGIIRQDFDPVKIAREYGENGAAAVSVLTEEDFFLGCPDFLRQIRAAVEVPLLRKDFILDPYQVVEARVLGADAFLLIASLLTDRQMEELIILGRELSMTALVEVHTQEELSRALHSSAQVIGVNNRDLKTFVTDISNTLRLAPQIPAGKVVISESGIASVSDLERLEHSGVDAVLVGESLMRSRHPGEKLREMLAY